MEASNFGLINPIKEWEATALGNLLKDGEIVPGDYVEAEFRNNEWLIHKVLKRKNRVFRTLQRENQTKTLASNVDYLILVFSIERPEFKRGLLDRYLLRSSQWSIPTLVIFNKYDLLDSENCSLTTEQISIECQRLKSLVEQFFTLSAKFPDDKLNIPPIDKVSNSLEELISLIKNKTVIFMGQSGVGKSKLIQTLSKGKLQTLSQELGVVGKGVHTTTWTELHLLPQLNLMDSPGIRSLSINDIEAQNLLNYMPDLLTYSHKCKFHNCTHEEKSKACIFWSKEFTSNPLLESRFQSYLRFKQEIESGNNWDKDY